MNKLNNYHIKKKLTVNVLFIFILYVKFTYIVKQGPQIIHIEVI
jgi:hypothetical protein